MDFALFSVELKQAFVRSDIWERSSDRLQLATVQRRFDHRVVHFLFDFPAQFRGLASSSRLQWDADALMDEIFHGRRRREIIQECERALADASSAIEGASELLYPDKLWGLSRALFACLL